MALPDLISSKTEALENLGGAAQFLVCDQRLEEDETLPHPIADTHCPPAPLSGDAIVLLNS